MKQITLILVATYSLLQQVDAMQLQRVLSREHMQVSSNICAICLDSTEPDCLEKVIRLPCYSDVKHIFHVPCLEKWKSVKSTCPLCMRDLPEEKNSLFDRVLNKYGPLSTILCLGLWYSAFTVWMNGQEAAF